MEDFSLLQVEVKKLCSLFATFDAMNNESTINLAIGKAEAFLNNLFRHILYEEPLLIQGDNGLITLTLPLSEGEKTAVIELLHAHGREEKLADRIAPLI